MIAHSDKFCIKTALTETLCPLCYNAPVQNLPQVRQEGFIMKQMTTWRLAALGLAAALGLTLAACGEK